MTSAVEHANIGNTRDHERDSRGRFTHIWGVAATIPTEIWSCEGCNWYRTFRSSKLRSYEQIEAKYPSVQWGS